MDKGRIAELLRQLVTTDGLSGAEDRVRALVRDLGMPYVDEMRVDAMGNAILHRRGAPGSTPGRVMLAAHMDEIGLIVTRIDRGFLNISKVGGVDPRTLVGREVTVYPSGPGAEQYTDGLPGLIGSRPPHVLSAEEREKVIPLKDLRVDLGGAGIETVRVGDRVAVCGPYTELMGGRVATKALDNRAGVAAMLGCLGYLAHMSHTWDVFAVATAQEETGLLGATTSAFGVAPDIAIALDVTFADTPGLNDSETVEWDKGPSIGWGPNLHPGIVKALRATADDLEMSYVNEPIPGSSGTDAWAIQVTREGIPTGLLSIPVRYMHSAAETVVLADIDRTARLLAAFISRLDETFVGGLVEEV
jgi:tetrahedral aminopeptidase